MLFEGKYYILRNDPQKAVPVLEDCRSLFLQSRHDLELQSSIIWLSAAYCQTGEHERAAAVIQEILSAGTSPDHALMVLLCKVSQWLKPLLVNPLVGRRLNSLVEKAQRNRNKLPVIRRNLRRHASFIQVPSASLVIRAFGNPEVSVNGKTVQMSDWRTQSVRDLFFYFLHSQEAVTKEQLGAVLWPEIPTVQALKARFKNEIYRLRRAVGRDVIIFDDEYYRFNHQLEYEYDVEAFDSHIARARKTADVNNRIEHLRKAVDLVHGPYLADVDAEWTILERERLWHSYGTALDELAYLYLDANQLENCLLICQKALQRNRFHEAVYQIEMRAYAILGDRSAVAHRYQTCRAAMAELGIQPSAETERTYRELAG